MTPQELIIARRNAIASIESRGSGGYSAIGPETNGDRPYGRYQVMGNNVPDWTQRYLGKSMTPQEYLASPASQDAVFDKRFGGYADKYGEQGAAQAWIGGPGSVGKNLGKTDINGTSVGAYGQRYLSALQSPNIQQPQVADAMAPVLAQQQAATAAQNAAVATQQAATQQAAAPAADPFGGLMTLLAMTQQPQAPQSTNVESDNRPKQPIDPAQQTAMSSQTPNVYLERLKQMKRTMGRG